MLTIRYTHYEISTVNLKFLVDFIICTCESMPQMFFPFILEVLILVRVFYGVWIRLFACSFACTFHSHFMYNVFSVHSINFFVSICAGFNGEKLFTDYLHRRSTLHRVWYIIMPLTVWIWYKCVYCTFIYSVAQLVVFGTSPK